jgi:Zn-dependent protease with chaperone function
MSDRTRTFSLRAAVALSCALALATPGRIESQTKIKAGKNSYTPAQDVQLGQEAAAQVRKELPLLRDERVDAWVDKVGTRLVAALPAEFAHPEFRYTFDVVNQKEINAFALPGGPMFLNRGMIEAAKTEAEVAGVMAHELSHVALRHGTAQATKAQKFQIGAILGQIAGAAVGGTLGSIIGQGSQIGLGTYFLKFGRAAESEADLLGAQMLARAGYDPRQMANMFKTIEAEGGNRGPEFLSDHPNPGNRYNAINKEADSLRIQGNYSTGEFDTVLARLKGMSPALTAEQIARNNKASTPAPSGRTVRVEPPVSQARTYQPAQFLRVSVPANWQQLQGSDTVTYAPEGGYTADSSGHTSFTHGLQVGVAQGGSGDLQRDTTALLKGFARSNPDLRSSGSRRESIGGRKGLTTMLTNRSDATGQPESIAVSTTHLKDGNVLFLVGVAPASESPAYENAFSRVRQTLQIRD